MEQTIEFFQLYRTAKLSLAESRENARAGKRDAAKAVWRLIHDGKILEILSHVEFPSGFPVDVPHLKWQADELEREFHHHTEPCVTSDMATIRQSLAVIASYIQKNETKSPKGKL